MKVAIVTGAMQGLGLEISKQLISNNFRVYMLDVNDEINQVAKSIDAKSFVVDVRNHNKLKAVITEIYESETQIDLLVNNAGLGIFKLFEEHQENDYDLLFDVNVKGVFNITKPVVSIMKEQKFGTIITIGSDVAKRTIENGTIYAASKYAIRGMMGSLSQELRSYGVRVSLIHPGLMNTYFNDSKPGEDYKEGWLNPEVIAKTVLSIYNMPKAVIVDEIVIHPAAQDYTLN